MLTTGLRAFPKPKGKAGAGNGLFKIKSGLGARLKTLANPTTREQKSEMSKLKKLNEAKTNNDHRNTQDSPENHVVNKSTKRKATDHDEHGITQSVNKRKKKDIRAKEEKESILTYSKGIEAKDAEQPKAIEQEKETRSRRKRVRIMNERILYKSTDTDN